MSAPMEHSKESCCVQNSKEDFTVLYKVKDWNILKMTARSSCPDVFCEKGVLRNFAKFTGKRLHQSLFFKKVACGAFPGIKR